MKLALCIVAALLALAAIPLFILTGWGEKFGKKRAYLMVFCSALFFCSIFAGVEPFFSILGNFWPGGLYSAKITPDVPSFAIPLTRTGEITLNIKNTGRLTWDSTADSGPVLLSWHLLSERGSMIRFDNPRTPFPRSIPPGDSESVAVQMSPASEGIPAGRYIIEFDLVCEDAAWFADRGSATCRVLMEVLP